MTILMPWLNSLLSYFFCVTEALTSLTNSATLTTGGHIDPGGMTPARTLAMPPPVTVPTRKAIRAFKLSSVTKSLNIHQMEDYALQSMKRILAAEGGHYHNVPFPFKITCFIQKG